MPEKRFNVVVEPKEKDMSIGSAIASASSYLTYADTTNTFGQSRSMYSASVRTDGNSSIVDLSFEVMIENESHYHQFTDELEKLAQVKDWWSRGYNE